MRRRIKTVCLAVALAHIAQEASAASSVLDTLRCSGTIHSKTRSGEDFSVLVSGARNPRDFSGYSALSGKTGITGTSVNETDSFVSGPDSGVILVKTVGSLFIINSGGTNEDFIGCGTDSFDHLAGFYNVAAGDLLLVQSPFNTSSGQPVFGGTCSGIGTSGTYNARLWTWFEGLDSQNGIFGTPPNVFRITPANYTSYFPLFDAPKMIMCVDGSFGVAPNGKAERCYWVECNSVLDLAD